MYYYATELSSVCHQSPPLCWLFLASEWADVLSVILSEGTWPPSSNQKAAPHNPQKAENGDRSWMFLERDSRKKGVGEGGSLHHRYVSTFLCPRAFQDAHETDTKTEFSCSCKLPSVEVCDLGGGQRPRPAHEPWAVSSDLALAGHIMCRSI